MEIKRTTGERVFDVANVVFMCVLMVLFLYPIYYIVCASISDPDQFMRFTGILLAPTGFSFKPLGIVLTDPKVLLGYKNTLIVLAGGLIINMVLTILAAYVLSRRSVMYRNALMLFISFTMYFGGGLVPFYLTMQSYGDMSKTLWILMLPQAMSAYNMIIMRTAFAGVPESLEESALLDGATHITIMARIIVPLCVPTIMVIVLYYAVHIWNSWFHASIFLDDSRFPLQLILRQIVIQQTLVDYGEDIQSVGETIKYSTIVVATAPILVLYPFLQRFFVKGVMIGAVKG